MAIPRTVWGIDVGQCGLKALKLREADGELVVDEFEYVAHEKILSEPDADRKQLIHAALEGFLSRHNLLNSTVAISVPGASSFSRFVKLPPVEPSKVPDIVRFEAEQQIPFPINDVHWRWQTFQDEDSPDVEVGIFAMKKIDVAEALSNFVETGISVSIVQMAPLALYNFMKFDDHASSEGATLLCDIGADKTDLVVSDGSRLWTRTIQIGGNSFTEALVRAFKLSFSKAEEYKKSAASSKYARQIFQAMRPVFADLVQEIQRCIGFYTSTHRESRFKKLVGLGNGFRLPGLQKFLEQNLNIPVVRVDQYNKLTTGPNVNAPQFQEQSLSFAVAYGLALQGMQLGVVNTNLLPTEVARKRVWAAKRPWFVGAAAVLVAAMAMPLYKNYTESKALGESSPALEDAQRIGNSLQDLRNKINAVKGANSKTEEAKLAIQDYRAMFNYRDYWPDVLSMVNNAILKSTWPEVGGVDFQKMLRQLADCRDKAERDRLLGELKKTDRGKWRMIVLERLSAEYVPAVGQFSAVDAIRKEAGMSTPGGATPTGTETPAPGRTGSAKRGFWVVMRARTPVNPQVANDMLNTIKLQKLDEKAVTSFKIEKVVGEFAAKTAAAPGAPGAAIGAAGIGASAAPAANPATPAARDPLQVDDNDTSFVVGWLITVEDPVPDKI